MLIPKSPKIKNKKHLMFVANQRCCLCTVAADWSRGNVQAHHNNVVPLCYGHHAELHDVEGHEDNFWVNYNLEEDFGRKTAEYWWNISPYNKERFKK